MKILIKDDRKYQYPDGWRDRILQVMTYSQHSNGAGFYHVEVEGSGNWGIKSVTMSDADEIFASNKNDIQSVLEDFEELDDIIKSQVDTLEIIYRVGGESLLREAFAELEDIDSSKKKILMVELFGRGINYPDLHKQRKKLPMHKCVYCGKGNTCNKTSDGKPACLKCLEKEKKNQVATSVPASDHGQSTKGGCTKCNATQIVGTLDGDPVCSKCVNKEWTEKEMFALIPISAEEECSSQDWVETGTY